MYIYKSIFQTTSVPTVIEKNIVLPDSNGTVDFKIHILPTDVSLYNVFYNASEYSKISMSKVECFLYIVSDVKLIKSIIGTIETFIGKEVNDTVKNENLFHISPFEVVNSPREAIDLYKRITFHFSTHSNDKFTYVNYRDNFNNDNVISDGDTKVEYVHLNDRHTVCLLAGKVKENQEVLLFNMYPLKDTYKVFILPPDFVVLKESSNKIAYVVVNDSLIFWLVTHHTFLSSNPDQMNLPPRYDTNNFCPKSLSNLDPIFEVFFSYNFNDLLIKDTCVVSEDAASGIIMFIGVYEMQFGNKYAKYFQSLL